LQNKLNIKTHIMRQLELNIRNILDLEKAIDTLSQKRHTGVTITCKKTNLDTFMIISELQKYYPHLDITPTFSIANHYEGSADKTYQKFLKSVAFAQTFDVNSFLLVSGNPRKKLDTIECLQRFSEFRKWVVKSSDNEQIKNLNSWYFSIAYNPFLKDMEKENSRLVKKLASNSIRNVYLQIGEDLVKMQKAVELILSINPKITIWVSVLIPSQKLLTRMAFRPWGGVFLSTEYLSSLKYAKEKTEEIIAFCVSNNLGILETQS
jgi:hypothetical protein